MGLYLKKAFNFGPLRVNFSKSGLGLSFGIKGMRIGSGPGGNYIHGGRKGLYFKKSLPQAGYEPEMWKVSWPILMLIFLVTAAVYFYLKAEGDIQVMMKLFFTHLSL